MKFNICKCKGMKIYYSFQISEASAIHYFGMPQDSLQQHIGRHCHSQNGGPASGIFVWGIGRSLMVPNLESEVHGATDQSRIFPLLHLPIVLCKQDHCPGATKHKHAAFFRR